MQALGAHRHLLRSQSGCLINPVRLRETGPRCPPGRAKTQSHRTVSPLDSGAFP